MVMKIGLSEMGCEHVFRKTERSCTIKSEGVFIFIFGPQ